MTEKKKVVLIVEKESMLLEYWEKMLEKNAVIIAARNSKEALEIFESNKDIIDIVVMGSCKKYMGDMTTEKTTKEIRKNFSGLMIPMSSDPDFIERLIKSGCSNFCKIEVKVNLPGILKKILQEI